MTRKNRRKPSGPAIPKRGPEAGSPRTYWTVQQCSSFGRELIVHVRFSGSKKECGFYRI